MGLKEQYATMETKELVNIITLSKDQYTREAIQAAKAELKNRGETAETLVPILKDLKEEKQTLDEQSTVIEERPLSHALQVLFTILPATGFYYLMFTPINWKKRKLEADLCCCRGTLCYLGIFTLIVGVLELTNPKDDFPILYFSSIIIICFIGFVLFYRSTKRKLAQMEN